VTCVGGVLGQKLSYGNTKIDEIKSHKQPNIDRHGWHKCI